MRISWFIWLGATVLVILYAWAGSVASRTDMIGLTLEPGYSTQVRLFRFAEDRLRLRLIFHGDHLRRPELGSHSTLRLFALIPLHRLKCTDSVIVATSADDLAIGSANGGANNCFRRTGG
jgi:hypothetical protein